MTTVMVSKIERLKCRQSSPYIKKFLFRMKIGLSMTRCKYLSTYICIEPCTKGLFGLKNDCKDSTVDTFID